MSNTTQGTSLIELLIALLLSSYLLAAAEQLYTLISHINHQYAQKIQQIEKMMQLSALLRQEFTANHTNSICFDDKFALPNIEFVSAKLNKQYLVLNRLQQVGVAVPNTHHPGILSSMMNQPLSAKSQIYLSDCQHIEKIDTVSTNIKPRHAFAQGGIIFVAVPLKLIFNDNKIYASVENAIPQLIAQGINLKQAQFLNRQGQWLSEQQVSQWHDIVGVDLSLNLNDMCKKKTSDTSINLKNFHIYLGR